MIYFSSEASDEKQSRNSSRFLAPSKQAPNVSESRSGRDGRHLRMRIGRSFLQMFSIDSKDFAASMQPPSVSNAAEPDVRTRSFSSVSGSSKSSRTQISVYFMPLIVLSQDHSKRRPWESLMRAYSSASRSSLAHPSFFLSVQGALGDEYHGVGNFSASGIDTDIVASGELNASFSFTIEVDPNVKNNVVFTTFTSQ